MEETSLERGKVRLTYMLHAHAFIKHNIFIFLPVPRNGKEVFSFINFSI